MIYAEEYASIRDAVARERQLKRWTAMKKEALVAGNLSTLKILSRRTNEQRSRITFTWRDLSERGR
jgi:predicted GIY-YIG superfamily endonuclease